MLLDLRRFDAHRASNPDTRITGSGSFYPIGADRGYVGLTSDRALLNQVNTVLADLQAAGTMGRAAGLSYLPPRGPAIQGDE